MKAKIYSGIAVFAIAVCAGYFAGTRSWNGVVLITDGSLFENTRVPAAIKKELDFSRLDGAELMSATQNRLVAAAKIVSDAEGEVGIELGHFVTRGEDGKRKLACDSHYNRVTLRFEAEGVAEGGERATMEMDGPCRVNFEDINSIAPIWIPVRKIVKERPTDMDLSFDDDVKFRFVSMGTRWPLRWALQSVRLYNSEEKGREVRISARELREIRQKSLVVNWHDATRLPSATAAPKDDSSQEK